MKGKASQTIGLLVLSFSIGVIGMTINETYAEIPLLDTSVDDDSERDNIISYPIYTGNRNYIFADSEIDFCVFSGNNQTYHDIAIKAVKDWHDNLTKVTGNDKVWDMTVQVEPKDTSTCDGFINFYKTPNEILHQIYGVAGYSYPYTQIANVTIYTDSYQETLLKISQDEWAKMSEEKFDEIIKTNMHPVLNSTSIYRITLHELGHALSLNHPQEEQEWGTLSEAKGIMGYDYSETQILSNEVKQIVKAYPNGFTNQKSKITVQLDEYDLNNTFYVGEKAGLIIEAPYAKNDLPIDSISVYIFPEGKMGTQKYNAAPIKLVKEHGTSDIFNNGEYFDNIQVTQYDLVGHKFIFKMNFVPKKVTSNTDITIIIKDLAGNSEQVELKKPFSIKSALFSEILLEDKNKSWALNWSLT